MKKQTGKAKNSFIHNFLTVVGIILCILLIPMLVMNVTLLIKSVTSDEVPSLGGWFPQIVLTDSMSPSFSAGDMILCSKKDPEEIEVGDVISFYDPAGDGTAIVTHRVVSLTETKDGEPAWVTRGDANNVDDAEPVPYDALVGIWSGVHFAGLGSVAMFMQTTKGLILCVLVPLILLIGYDIIRRRLYEKNNRKDTAALLEELEELRAAKAKKEAEREAAGSKAAEEEPVLTKERAGEDVSLKRETEDPAGYTEQMPENSDVSGSATVVANAAAVASGAAVAEAAVPEAAVSGAAVAVSETVVSEDAEAEKAAAKDSAEFCQTKLGMTDETENKEWYPSNEKWFAKSETQKPSDREKIKPEKNKSGKDEKKKPKKKKK